MKTSRQFIAVFIAAVMALVLAVTTVPAAGEVISLSSEHSQFTPILSTTASQPQAQGTPKSDFDGHRLYREVFRYLFVYDMSLTDPAKRAKWAAEWENKHKSDGMLDTEDGADKAIFEMMFSLGHRFNFYNRPAANAAEQERSDASLVGIGTPVGQKGVARALKALGDNPTEQQIRDLQKIVDERPFWLPDAPIAGGPAEKAGLRAGDRITRVDDVPVNGKTFNEVVDMIRGAEGTTVKITYLRNDGNGGATEMTVKIVRARITAKVAKTRDMGTGITHIRLSDFSSRFAESEMVEALSASVRGKAVIIDLRGNPGGRLDAVKTIAEYLLPQGHVLTIKERQGNAMLETRTYLQPTSAITEQIAPGQPGQSVSSGPRSRLIVPADMPIVVLVDEGSASASEILAGLLQANKRAVIVGKTTIGKGVGQTVIQLSFSRNIHITSFEFLPGGQAMDWVGVVPDIEVERPDSELDEPLVGGKDSQLDAAVKVAGDAVAAKEALEKKKSDLKQSNEKKWKEALEKSRKARLGNNGPSSHELR